MDWLTQSPPLQSLLTVIALILVGSLIWAASRRNKGNEAADGEADEAAETVETVSDDGGEAVHFAEDSAELIAVITAALMMYSRSGKRLVVRSVRRAGKAPAWAQAGRRDQLDSRF